MCVRVNVSGCVWVAFVCCCFACDCVLELAVCRVRFARVSCPWLRFVCLFTGYPGSSLTSHLSPQRSTTRMLSTLVRRVLADMRSSDWSFYGGTYAAILASMVAAGGSAMYLIGPLADTAEIQARRRKRN